MPTCYLYNSARSQRSVICCHVESILSGLLGGIKTSTSTGRSFFLDIDCEAQFVLRFDQLHENIATIICIVKAGRLCFTKCFETWKDSLSKSNLQIHTESYKAYFPRLKWHLSELLGRCGFVYNYKSFFCTKFFSLFSFSCLAYPKSHYFRHYKQLI